jgi:hypothetical protein
MHISYDSIMLNSVYIFVNLVLYNKNHVFGKLKNICEPTFEPSKSSII